MKKILQIVLIITLTISLVGCGYEKQKTEKKIKKVKEKVKEKYNTESGIIKEQTVDEFEISNISLKFSDNMYTFSADVKNKSEGVKKIESFDIIIKDKDNQEITTLLGYIGKDMQKDQMETVTAMTDTDLSKAKIVEYRFIK